MNFSRLGSRCFLLLCLLTLLKNDGTAQDDLYDVPQDEFIRQWDTVSFEMASLSLEETPTWHAMVTNIPGDWLRSVNVIFRSESVPTLLGIGALTGVLAITDKESFRGTQTLSRESQFFRSGSGVLVRAGDAKYHLALAGGFALYGVVSGDRRALTTASQTVEALLAGGIVVQVLKRMTGRESPGASPNAQGKWRMFPNLGQYNRHQPQYYAFPSGHITTVTTTFTVLSENYPEATWIRPLGYSVISLVGVGLVAKGYHWYSDLPLGIALGYTFGKLVAHPERSEESPEPRGMLSNIRLLPVVTANGTGVACSLTF
jgi:membrane-associated phospholipid phosphatase